MLNNNSPDLLFMYFVPVHHIFFSFINKIKPSYIGYLGVALAFSVVLCYASNKPKQPRVIFQKAEFSKKIDSILSGSDLSSCFIGLKVVSLNNGKTLYARNSNKLFNPASNMKLLTTATALAKLNPDYKFKTKFSTSSKIDNGILQGDLFVESSGDPMLMTQHLDSLISQLTKLGVTSIKGNIVGDTSLFDGMYWGKGWFWDDEPESYEAYISPLTVNSNSLKFKVKPANKIGDTALVELTPPVHFYTAENSAITSSDTSLPKVNVTRPSRENTFTITGHVSPSDTGKEFELSVWQPEWYFLNLLKERLAANGITLSGKCKIGKAKRGQLLAEYSHTLDSVLTQINKPSDNLGAENLLKTLGKEKFGAPGTAEHGLDVVRNYLLRLGVDTSQVVLSDGSGLSMYDQISPDVLIGILKYQYKQKSFPRFYESLPVAGVDGTLKNRMKWTKCERNVHAKTGTISGASMVSGYVTTADSTMLAFSFMCNHFAGDLHIVRNVQDKILEELAEMRMK